MTNRLEKPLFLGVIRNVNAQSRNDNPHLEETNAEYVEARERFIEIKLSKTVAGEGLACEACAIEMTAGYHVHHKDGDHTNNDYNSNFSLRCPFCHMVEHIGLMGQERKAIIIKAPEFTQEQLNLIQWSAYCTEYYLTTLAKDSAEYEELMAVSLQARTLIRLLETGKIWVERFFQSYDPEHFANLMLGMSEDEYQTRSEGVLSGLRILYKKEAFQEEIKVFAKTVFGMDGKNNSYALHPNQWLPRARIFKSQKNDGI